MTIHARHPRAQRPHGRPHEAMQPKIVVWESTRACQLTCRHCRTEAGRGRNPFELTADEATKLMADVLSFGTPSPIFVISGGDCFERDDLYEIVKRGVDMGLEVAVSPSGTDRLDRANLRKLQDVGVGIISLSLDGANGASHDGFRCVQGAFDRTIAGWEAARELGMTVQLNTVITRQNVLELPAIAEIVRDLGVLNWSSHVLMAKGRAVDFDALTAEETEDVLNLFYDLLPRIPVKTTECRHFRRVALQRQAIERAGGDPVDVMNLGPLYTSLRAAVVERGLLDGDRSRPPVDLSTGNGSVFVNHVGQVTPSAFLDVAAGNVRDTSIVDLYRSSELFTGIRRPDLLEGRCGACEYNTVCGGSRSRAYNSTGNIFAEDPLCSYEPGSFPFADEVATIVEATRPSRG